MELPSGQAAGPPGPPGFPAYQLIGSTKLLRLIVPSNLPGVVSRKPNIYVILDRSGSMDRWCELAISTAIPSALQQQGLLKKNTFFSRNT